MNIILKQKHNKNKHKHENIIVSILFYLQTYVVLFWNRSIEKYENFNMNIWIF